jgi:hypothetical protein
MLPTLMALRSYGAWTKSSNTLQDMDSYLLSSVIQ